MAHNPDALWQNVTIPMSLSRLMPSIEFPTFVHPLPPGHSQWSHPHFHISPGTSPEDNTITRTHLHTPAGLRLFILT